ncbi:hypothetical protein L484_000085 [Morus notabilis]|uniref:Uncharacterized protein n=1 Tax=Morus notabilis TaxID=981085 RepID=W9SER7_9ROSA|nr:hypothetical protein L484_000085 [Morus notabilis]
MVRSGKPALVAVRWVGSAVTPAGGGGRRQKNAGMLEIEGESAEKAQKAPNGWKACGKNIR